jgi:hypothetical protein
MCAAWHRDVTGSPNSSLAAILSTGHRAARGAESSASATRSKPFHNGPPYSTRAPGHHRYFIFHSQTHLGMLIAPPNTVVCAD